MADSTPPNDQEQQSPWRRPAVLLSGAFLLALILAGILVAVLGGGGGQGQRRTRPQVSVRPSPPSSTPTSSTACTLPAGSQAVPSVTPPADTHWSTVGSMQIPQAPSLYGPQRTQGGLNRCFAHNPSGALLAAMNLYAEDTAADPNQVYTHLAVGAPANVHNTSRLDSGGPVQFAGYRYDAYSPSNADLSIVIRGPQGKLGAIVTPMTWTGDDWKYVFPHNGVPSLQILPDLTGYVQWSDF